MRRIGLSSPASALAAADVQRDAETASPRSLPDSGDDAYAALATAHAAINICRKNDGRATSPSPQCPQYSNANGQSGHDFPVTPHSTASTLQCRAQVDFLSGTSICPNHHRKSTDHCEVNGERCTVSYARVPGRRMRLSAAPTFAILFVVPLFIRTPRSRGISHAAATGGRRRCVLSRVCSRHEWRTRKWEAAMQRLLIPTVSLMLLAIPAAAQPALHDCSPAQHFCLIKGAAACLDNTIQACPASLLCRRGTCITNAGAMLVCSSDSSGVLRCSAPHEQAARCGTGNAACPVPPRDVDTMPGP